ncbi:MAG: RNA polymerase sigma factor [Acidimicrobiia bacterium]|nr:sigma-70 family RNA polymerase sigma factor [Acidimicrobiia bacterium]
MDEPDPGLIRAAAKGDHDAFAQLVRAHQTMVWHFLCRLLDDRSLAEDVTQETFIRVFMRLPTFSYRSRFSTWVFAIARNAGIDALRARNRRDRLAHSVADVNRDLSLSSPAGQIDLEMSIAALPTKLREAFLLVEVSGLRYDEAANVLRIPVGTVKSRIYHARQALIRELGERL